MMPRIEPQRRGAIFPVLSQGTLIISCLGGCDHFPRNERPSVTVEHIDSAGVPIVVNRGEHSEAHASGWWIGSEPSNVLSGDDPVVAGFFGLRPAGGVVRLATGTLVVINAFGAEVLFMRSDGAHIVTIDGGGGGPNEFRRADRVVPHPAGGVAVWDAIRSRLVILDSVGTFVEAIAVSDLDARNPWASMSGDGGLRGFLPNGSFVMVREFPLDIEAQEVRRRYMVAIYAPTGTLAYPLEILYGPQLSRPAGASRAAFGLSPFDASPRILTQGGRIVIVDPVRSEVRQYDTDGTPIGIMRRDNPSRIVTDHDIAEYKAAVEAAVDSGSLTAAVMQHVANLEWPLLHAAFSGALVAPGFEMLLLEPGACKIGRHCWGLYDSGGSFVGTVRLPPDFNPQQLGRESLIGTALDEHGAASVRILPIERRW